MDRNMIGILQNITKDLNTAWKVINDTVADEKHF